MTVQTTTSRADYTGNGVTTAFTVPFYFLDNTHVLILRTQISTSVTTTLALTTDYTVSGAGVGSGGTVTCLVAPTSDQKISILRNVPLTQLTHYVENDPFPAASHEKALDQLTMEVQQLNEVQNRSLTLSKATSGVSATLPNPTANLVIAWNPTATGLVNVDASTLASNISYGQTKTQTASGNGSTTAFTLSSTGTTVNNVQVYIGGVRQAPTTDYTLAVDGVTLTFTSAPPSGTNNILFVWQQSLPIGTLPSGATYSGVTFTSSVFGGSFSGTVTGSITGNAGTVTNGLYSTGSYADPTWLTSLAGSKISGDIAGNAGTVTNGLYSTGSYANPAWLTSLAATKLTGTVATGTGGTGVTSTPTNGQLLIGNGSGYTLATITAGSNITVTNSSGGITIAASSSGVTTGKAIAMAIVFGG